MGSSSDGRRRRHTPPADKAAAGARRPSAAELSAVQARLDHLEAVVEGLQDAVYRDAQRHARELAELRHAIQPAEIARSLSGDARRRGI